MFLRKETNIFLVISGLILISIGFPFLYVGLRTWFFRGDFRAALPVAIGGASAVITGLMLLIQSILKKVLITLGIGSLSSGLFLLCFPGTLLVGVILAFAGAFLAIGDIIFRQTSKIKKNSSV